MITKSKLLSFYKLYKAYNTRQFECSFSQYGEDVIVRQILNSLKIYKPTYLDIGAHDPITLSNTYSFYLRHSRGVLIEPNSLLIPRLKKYREYDTIVNAGIGNGIQKDAILYILKDDVLSTFSHDEALEYEKKGHQIKSELSIELIGVNEVIDKYMGISPDFVSLDIEGKEMEVLTTFNFEKYRPKVFCIETWSYAKTMKETEIIDFMIKNNYTVAADTTLNTIFKDRNA